MSLNPPPEAGIPEVVRLKKFLWRGTLALDAVFMAVVLLCWPQYWKPAFSGACLGLFYLWSLFFNAEHPKRKIQFAFSLMRIAILAYAIVSISHARLPELTIVICGFLSYKVVLTADAAVQVVSGLRRANSKPTSGLRPRQETVDIEQSKNTGQPD